MALYMDDDGRVRDDETGRFGSMLDYLDQLAEEAYEEAALAGEHEDEDEGEGEGEGESEDVDDFPRDFDDFPDYWLDGGDEVELTIDLAYDEEGA